MYVPCYSQGIDQFQKYNPMLQVLTRKVYKLLYTISSKCKNIDISIVLRLSWRKTKL